MATEKITEQASASSVKNTSSVLITQSETVNGQTTEAVRRATLAKFIAALRANGVNDGYVTAAALQEMYADLVKNVEATADGIRVTFWNDDYENIPIESGGLAFDSGYVDENGYMHFTANGEEVDGFDPFYVGTGGGGGSSGGSALTFACYTSPTFSVLDTAAAANIEYKFTSLDTTTEAATGSGTMRISVGGVVKTNITVQQGDHLTVNVLPYLASGTNTVQLRITDSYGSSATRTFTVTVESFSLAWSLNDVQINMEENLTFTYTPTGSGSKTVYTYVDGVLHSTDVIASSGRRTTKTIYGLSHGAHRIEVYGEMTISGDTLESNHLTAAVAQVVEGEVAAMCAVNWPSGDLEQFTAVTIPYIVVDPQNNPATVKLYEGTTLVNTVSVDQTVQAWAYRPTADGDVTVSVVCGSVSAQHTYYVEGLTISAEEVTDGLVCKVDPSTMSSIAGWSYGSYRFTTSQDFDLVNGGIVLDSAGVPCIRVTAGDRLTLSYDPFAVNAVNSGLELKIIYKITNCSNKRAVGISSMNSGRGLQVMANNAYLYGNQNTAELSVCEGEKTELDVTIQQRTANSDRLMMLWERCSTFAIKQYASDENFQHGTNVGITFGSDDADVYLYLLRAYNRDLTNTEIKANYIVDGASGAEIYERDTRNAIYSNGQVNFELAAAANPDCHFILINAEKISTAKKKNGGTVSGTLRHVYGAGGAAHSFTADLNMDLQGTSSEEHALTAGPNLNLRFPHGMVFDSDPETVAPGYAMHGSTESIAVDLFNYKKNVASQDHIVNRVCAEWYNRFQPSVRQVRVTDPRVRDCLECTMCAVFFHNTSDSAVVVGPDTVQPDETIFFGLGNLCSSKDCFETFEYDDIVIEVKNNTEDQVRFKSDDLTGDNFDNNYEFRYLNENHYTEAQAKAAWQQVQTFVYETDWTEATDAALPAAVTISGVTYYSDTAEYRKARWIAEAPTIFDMDTLYWHHCITLFFLLRDNRAKNMFWSKSNDTGKWGLWFNWDNDTGLCRNNRGYVDIEPGYMDWDSLGTQEVFNASDNALFTNLRECNFAQIRAMYVDREAAGAWDLDAIYGYCKESQEQICESLWIEDAEHNAIRILENMGNSSYLERATGRLQLHVKKSLLFQKALIDSYFSAAASTTDRARLRGNTPSQYSGIAPSGIMKITPYTNLFVTIHAGSTDYTARVYEGVESTFDVSANLNDTEMYIYSAEWISGMGSLAALYLSQFEIGTMKRIRQVILGSAEGGYYNSAAVSLSFANCVKLETLNLAGLINTAVSVDLSNCLYLKEIDTRNSGITGLRFAKNGRLEEALLNALTSLYMSGLGRLDTFSMAAYTALQTFIAENTSAAVDTKAIVTTAAALENVRLLGIDWTLDNTNLLRRLQTLGGIADNGQDTTPVAVVAGDAHVAMIASSDLISLGASFPNLSITYDQLIPSYTVTFKNYDSTTLDTQTVSQGSAPDDPTTRELLPIATPARASTISTVYTFDGWSWTNGGSVIEDLSAIQITDNTTLFAHYTETVRTYTIRWYNGTELLESQTHSYGDDAVYSGDTPVSSSDGNYAQYYLFKGWDKSTGFVNADLNVYAQYDSATAPMSKTLSQMSPEELKALVRQEILSPTGENNTLVASGDTIDIVAGNDFDFSNVAGHELVALGSPRTFDGTNYYKPQVDGSDILLFDSDKSWTLAIDFAYDTSSASGGALAACYHSNGFLLRYNSGGSVRYGTSAAQQVSANGVRQMTVIRHKAGDPKLYVYASNKNDTALLYSALEQANTPTHEAPLVFGASVASDGYVDGYGKGAVYWAKLWDGDLGDTVAREIAAWPRQTFTMQAVGRTQYAYRNFTRVDNGRYVNCAFLMKELLEETHQMNPTNTNVGSWAGCTMRTWLNTRIPNALPVKWRQLLLTVIVNANAGYQATTNYDPPAEDKIWLPSCMEMGFNTTQTPYNLESDATFSIFADNNARIKKLNFGSGAASNWWLRSPNTGNSGSFWIVAAAGGSSSNYAFNASGVAFGFCI